MALEGFALADGGLEGWVGEMNSTRLESSLFANRLELQLADRYRTGRRCNLRGLVAGDLMVGIHRVARWISCSC